MVEETVGGQEQWDLWHCGAGKKIRPMRKPEKGESKGQYILCVRMLRIWVWLVGENTFR